MPRKREASSTADDKMTRIPRYTAEVQPDEVIRRGSSIILRVSGEPSLDAARAISVAGHRVEIEATDGGRTVRVDTRSLPVGLHLLRIDELGPKRTGREPDGRIIPFVVVDTPAPVPDDVVVHHAMRVRIGEFDVERLAMEGAADAPHVDVFKVEHRKSGAPLQMAFDERGEPVDFDRELADLARRRQGRYGSIHPTLFDLIQRTDPGEMVRVAVWLQTPAMSLPDKPEKGVVRRPPDVEEELRGLWRAATSEFLDEVGRFELRPHKVDEAAPVVYGQMPAGRVAVLAERDDVAAVFLHEPEGVVDLSDSIAIANADDAHASGVTGRGINVAVYEDGPDDVTNLAITDQFLTNPATDAHARHTHGIIKNVEPNRPHGHVPDCNLHSANSMDLDAIRWAARDRRCTVISQSFHRSSEQGSSQLSFDDIYKDHLALLSPYPTICEAAGNGMRTEFVNHKGFNRLTVGNHNDAASAMVSDSVFRNPSSAHGDRELPEIAANGFEVTTVNLTLSGTSMAAPAVAGGAALIQQKSATLRSWPEGCRAILLAAAWRNPVGGTWRSDLIAGVDGADGSGALDSGAAVEIASNRKSPNNAPARRGWDVGTFRSSIVGDDGFATYVYRVRVPATVFGPRVKVALAWDSKVSTLDIFGISIPLSSHLTVDLDLHVRDSSGVTVATSVSWDNSYEIAEFAARRGETYEIRIRRWSGSNDVWYGVAWTVTGFEFIIDHLAEPTTVVLARR